MYILQEHDLLVDVTLFLWFKCKVHFSKITSDSLDGHKATYQDPFFIKVNMKIVNFQPKRPGETRVHVFRGLFALPLSYQSITCHLVELEASSPLIYYC